MAKEIELELLCDLSDDEIALRSQEVGAAVAEYDEVESAKKDAAKAYAEQLGEIRTRMRRLSAAIRSRSEKRMVHCCVEFHTPAVRVKRIIRLDTGEIVREEPMTADECQSQFWTDRESGKPN